MKKLFFAIAALAALSLLTPAAGFAQLDLTAYNQIGLYSDATASAASLMDVTTGATLQLYIVLSNPYDHEIDMRVGSVRGYELAVVHPATIVPLSVTWPTQQALNVGTTVNQIVGFGSPQVVYDNILHLATLSVLYLGDGAGAPIHFSPTTPASVEGYMAYLDENYAIITASPSSGSFDDPVFGINVDVVATNAASMDMIKAMYR